MVDMDYDWNHFGYIFNYCKYFFVFKANIFLILFQNKTIMAIIRRVKQKKREMINTDLSEDDSLIMNRF